MIRKDGFCPKTGAPLSEELEYDEQGHPQRATIPDEFTAGSQLPGELTNGAVTSSKAALFNHFRRSHQRHSEANDDLYRKAALGLHRLKRTAEGTEDWDIHVWYALRRRLAESGFEAEWMHTHTLNSVVHTATAILNTVETTTATCTLSVGRTVPKTKQTN